MRRRPVAVYRVIDEDELLGGDGGLFDAHTISAERLAAPVPPQPAATSGARRRPAPAPGLRSTALAVAALASIAAALLDLSGTAVTSTARPVASPVHPRPASAPRSAPASVAAGRRHARLARPANRSTHAQRKPATRARRRVEAALRPAHAAAGVTERLAQPRRPTTPPPGPAQEFGFER
jgi:hypothetical protein